MKTSVLFPLGGGAAINYASGRYYQQHPIQRADTATTLVGANDICVVPFIPFNDVTVSEVGYWREGTTAADVYVGIYDASGTLLTDCAVDTDTTQGLHAVSTTNVDLTGGNKYYIAINQSAQVLQGTTPGSANVPDSEEYFFHLFPFIGYDMDSGGTPAGSDFLRIGTGVLEKSRTAATLDSSISFTDGSWTAREVFIGAGVVVA